MRCSTIYPSKDPWHLNNDGPGAEADEIYLCIAICSRQKDILLEAVDNIDKKDRNDIISAINDN